MSMVEDLLLSWEREGAGEKTLTASVLQAQGKWTEKVQGAVTYMSPVEAFGTGSRLLMGKKSVLDRLIFTLSEALDRDGSKVKSLDRPSPHPHPSQEGFDSILTQCYGEFDPPGLWHPQTIFHRDCSIPE